MLSSSTLPTSSLTRGKRSRSNSSSSTSSSSSTTSSTRTSLFSHLSKLDSVESFSSPSSPATSNDASPSEEKHREGPPHKSLKLSLSPPMPALPDSKSSFTAFDAKTSGATCSFSSREREKPISAACGKTYFVDCLVDAAVHVLGTIWDAPIQHSLAFVSGEKLSVVYERDAKASVSCICPIGMPVTAGIPLDLFIRETLRRSRTSCSTLQAALLFCKRAGAEVVRRRAAHEGVQLTEAEQTRLPSPDISYASLLPHTPEHETDSILCSRRVFLASVMISSKFLQDRTFSNRAWSKISGLNVRELSQVERRLLTALGFDLTVRETVWESWTTFLKGGWRDTNRLLARCGLQHSLSQPCVAPVTRMASWTRTSSVPSSHVSRQEADVLEADVSLPTGDQQAFFVVNDLSAGLGVGISKREVVETVSPSRNDAVQSHTATPCGGDITPRAMMGRLVFAHFSTEICGSDSHTLPSMAIPPEVQASSD